MALPLDGIRVLDFTWVVAGPAATRVLADQGAEVIKVERRVSDFVIGTRRAGLMADLNRNKSSIAINMAVPAGVELAHRLVKLSDIVVDNFSARVMRQWGMDYPSLVKIKPDIICMSMSGFGHSGPRANFVSYGPTLQAQAGFTLHMADEQGRPAGFGYSYADMAGGYSGALAALAALWHRRRTGQGQFIDVSQFEALVSVTGPAMLDLTVNGRAQAPPRWDSQEAPAAPHGAYRCRPDGDDDDRWLVISVRSHSDWRRFVSAMGSPQWASDPGFRTLFQRMQNRAALDRHISEWTAGQDAWEAMRLLQRASVAAAVVSNAEDLCARDPQLKERGFWPAVDLPEGGQTHLSNVPFRLSETPASVRHCAPEVDEDRDFVLEKVLGLSPAEREALLAAQAIYAD
ncbi:MAG TPA: CoA transferase [Candidatus Binataceae bacterium]|nr:CoA transferase [Candidatus Binataceae bacterium]